MRAIATDRELDALRGDADVKDPDRYRRKARHRIRTRIKRLEQELDALDEDEPELAAALRLRVCHAHGDDELDDQMHAAHREIQRLVQVIAEEDADIDIDQLHRELRAGIDATDAREASGDGGDN